MYRRDRELQEEEGGRGQNHVIIDNYVIPITLLLIPVLFLRNNPGQKKLSLSGLPAGGSIPRPAAPFLSVFPVSQPLVEKFSKIRLLRLSATRCIMSPVGTDTTKRGDQMNIYFRENIRRLRKERDLTQEALADFLGVSFQAVSKWERGESYPDFEMLPVIADFFSVSTDELLGVDKAKNEKEILAICEKFDKRQYAGSEGSFGYFMKEASRRNSIFVQPVSGDELAAIIGGNGHNVCDQNMDISCEESHNNRIYDNRFPNCNATVEENSWCESNDACYADAIVYIDMKVCDKSWK